MDLKEAIYTRRATREFTAEPVSESIIRDLIDAAIQAPTAVNAQPCTFCVVRDKTVLATISKEAKAYMVRTTPVGLMSHHFTTPRLPGSVRESEQMLSCSSLVQAPPCAFRRVPATAPGRRCGAHRPSSLVV